MIASLFVVFFCVFVVMVGYGITLPVLPFYIERMALVGNATIPQAALQVGLLTAVFSLAQFIFAPLWGRWSDSVGRRPLFLVGLSGLSFSMLLFALGTNLATLYAARTIGGALSAATLPIAAASIADITSYEDRAQGMAWLGTATSLGVVLGPVLGAFMSKWELVKIYRVGPFRIDGFSIPFFAASLLSFLALALAIAWFPESRDRSHENILTHDQSMSPSPSSNTDSALRWIGPLLALAFLNYFGLALFEGTFALHAKLLLGFGSFEMGWIFMVCGLVMAVGQSALVPPLVRHLGEPRLLAMGFMTAAGGLILLMAAQRMASIILFVTVFALGVALITPTLASMVSHWAHKTTGKALGQLTAANSLGQTAGPVLGGFMISRQVHSPFLITSLLLGLAALYALLLIPRNGHRQ